MNRLIDLAKQNLEQHIDDQNVQSQSSIDCHYIDYKHYLTDAEIADIEHEADILEERRAAGIEALKIVQQQRGWISDESLYAIADLLQMSAAELDGIATFYNLIYRQPVGKYVIHLCNSISCYLTDFEGVAKAIKDELGIDYGQTTDDGLFTLITNACLGGCDKAPVMMIADRHFEHLTSESVVTLLGQIREHGLPELAIGGKDDSAH
ncbi:NADH-quinone oxidoreductase subunit NuoE [Thalassotalea sp. Y01]|uniref:NADH-quinone oxidoreductase subunit NuoE n=1 Tax=Thalassotalea sp. Y01 TaxID=2729613 RepID=UPI00145FA909|nr:NADH-quinone oxidoreductase subunit NuoE [Thalassotalea sp. Y01]NMP16834.1 NADH-quinone oxidoreductase subunit NuoE [Thalassotalea sp. Y01]